MRPDDKHFMRDIRDDAKQVWRRSILRVYVASSLREAACMTRTIATEEHGFSSAQAREADALEKRAFNELVALIDRQMLIPAPTVGELRWKEERRPVGGVNLATRDAAIQRDRERLRDEIEMFAKRGKRRRKERT